MTLRWSEQDLEHYVRRGQPDPLPAITEAVWQATIMRLLKDAGYMTFHVHDSRRSPSGWPDVAAIKPAGGTLYLCELKTETGQVTPAQQAWLEALAGCTGVVAECWRPAMLQEIVETLRGKAIPPMPWWSIPALPARHLPPESPPFPGSVAPRR